MIAYLCQFHGLLFARQCWMNSYATLRKAPSRNGPLIAIRLSVSALAICHELSAASHMRQRSGSADVRPRDLHEPWHTLRVVALKITT